MERKAFALLFEMEKSWWYKGRSLVASTLARKAVSGVCKNGLDYGAGNGGMCSTWKSICTHVDAFEPDVDAARIASTREYRNLYSKEPEIPKSAYDLVALCDVLEHIEDEKGALQGISSILRKDGVLVITVPAFQWLWSVHDVAHHHFRRYTRKELVTLLEGEGFKVVRSGYWNATLFIPAVCARLLNKTGEGALALPNFLNVFLFFLIKLEAQMLRIVRIPFGVSAVVVAIKV